MAMSSTIMLNSFALAVRLSRTCINAKDAIAESNSWLTRTRGTSILVNLLMLARLLPPCADTTMSRQKGLQSNDNTGMMSVISSV